MTFEDCFKIGYISKTHGLKGEVTAVFENEIEWDGLTSLFLDSKGSLVPYFLEKISGTTQKPFLKLEGIESFEQASVLKGSSIYILKSTRAKLKRGQFYDDEVVGFKIEDKNLGLIGHVKEIQSQGANRLISIINGSKEILIPINAPFISTLNKTKKLILVELPEGFIDL
ncbi:MAG TPA: ribosome maturation factor RimM [Saprospiraceae bacterium]|nr:ribosome maturation factor RimM [Saprospiraceae bacterium]